MIMLTTLVNDDDNDYRSSRNIVIRIIAVELSSWQSHCDSAQFMSFSECTKWPVHRPSYQAIHHGCL